MKRIEENLERLTAGLINEKTKTDHIEQHISKKIPTWLRKLNHNLQKLFSGSHSSSS